jgi:type VI secretion system protein VasG
MVQLTRLVGKLSPSLKDALENAVGEAMRRRCATVEPTHWLFHALLGTDDALQAFLEGQGVTLTALQAEFENRMPRGSGSKADRPTISGSLAKLLEAAWLIASIELEQAEILPETLLLAAMQPGTFGLRNETYEALVPVSGDAVRDFAHARGVKAASGPQPDGYDVSAPAGAVGEGALGKYTVNLTRLAREGELDAVVGRTDEVAKAIDVLLRKRQNNPILLGQPGVGKTAIVEGLAQKIVAGDVPQALAAAELLRLDMGLLQAGASVKGEFEERLKNVLKEVQSSDTPILMFIDEAHTMIGAGGTEGQNDAANLLKPALARGEFRTIAATTFAEYKKYFEKDPALSRRFQPITVEEPAAEAAVHILRRVSDGLAEHHGVLIQQEALRAAVDLSMRYMPARRLPDKAISVLDTACARVALSQKTRPSALDALEERLRFAETERDRTHDDATRFGNATTEIAELEARVAVLQDELGKATKRWNTERDQVMAHLGQDVPTDANTSLAMPETLEYVFPWVNAASIAAVVSDWTGVPLNNLERSEADRLLRLDEALKSRVIGQDTAVEAIARSLKISRAGLTDTRKPIGVFLMCGPSGVGKTETALAIAEQVFGGEDAITTINMTEFKEAHKTSMLLGAAAGYVGYGKGGVLTEAVRRRPYSVLLLDEMEKAHPAIHDIFFQIFDKGHISDSEGNDVDFRNTIIIMTANSGGEDIRSFVEDHDTPPDAEALAGHLRPILLDFFSPAFLGRTEIIAYRPLDAEASRQLVSIHMRRIRTRITAQYGAGFKWSDAFVDHVVRSNSDPLSGGRALEAIINRQLLPRLAERCIAASITNEMLDQIHVDYDGKELRIDLD